MCKFQKTKWHNDNNTYSLRDVFKLFGEPGHVNINNGKAIVAGWGKTYNSSKDVTKIVSTPKLQKLTVPVLSLDECIKNYGNLGLNFDNYIR